MLLIKATMIESIETWPHCLICFGIGNFSFEKGTLLMDCQSIWCLAWCALAPWRSGELHMVLDGLLAVKQKQRSPSRLLTLQIVFSLAYWFVITGLRSRRGYVWQRAEADLGSALWKVNPLHTAHCAMEEAADAIYRCGLGQTEKLHTRQAQWC